MIYYVRVADDNDDEPIELPTEDDNTLLLSNVAAQFPGICGLRYKNLDTGSFRGVRLINERFIAPDEGWNEFIFYCVYPKENKRKSVDLLENLSPKSKKIVFKRPTDMIVLGLAWKTTADSLREYFETFGEVVMTMIKEDQQTGKSRGFGFIRFANYESQLKVIARKHMIDGRLCIVRIPIPRETGIKTSKVFIGGISEDISSQDLIEYFSQFGEVIDVFLPQPCRGFAFVTFENPYIAHALYGDEHVIKQTGVRVSAACPRPSFTPQSHQTSFDTSSTCQGYQTGTGGNNAGAGDWSNDVKGQENSLDFPNLQNRGITSYSNADTQAQSNPSDNITNLLALAPALLSALQQAAPFLKKNLPESNILQNNIAENENLSHSRYQDSHGMGQRSNGPIHVSNRHCTW